MTAKPVDPALVGMPITEPVPMPRCTQRPPCGHCWYCEQWAKAEAAKANGVNGTSGFVVAASTDGKITVDWTKLVEASMRTVAQWLDLRMWGPSLCDADAGTSDRDLTDEEYESAILEGGPKTKRAKKRRPTRKRG